MVMHLHVFLATLLLGKLTLAAQNDTHSFFLNQNSLTQNRAERLCIEKGESWGLPMGNQDDSEKLKIYMERNNVEYAWLSIRKKEFQQWTWVNGSKFYGTLKVIPGGFCAGVAIQGMSLRSMVCGESGNGFVCEMPDGALCPFQEHPQLCFSIGGNVFYIGCFTENWFHARSYCVQHGGDLAVLDTVDKQHAVLNYVIERKFISDCGWLYAGLRMEDWYVQPSNEIPTDPSWGSDQPRIKHSCARTDRKGFWWSYPCDQPTNVICQKYQNKTEFDFNGNLFPKADIPNKSQSLVLLSPLLTSIILVSLVVALSVCIYKARHRKTIRRTKSDIPSWPNTVNIVIFSSKKLSHDDSDTRVFNIDWSKKLGEFQRNGGRSEQVKAIDKGGKIIKENCKLQIVNIHSKTFLDDKKCFLPKDCVQDVLQYLSEQSAVICVILLPKFERHLEYPKTVLRLLWDLRNKVIVISEATKSPSIPADEVIAVAGNLMLNVEQSGNVDFVVNDEARPNINKFGAAFVSGMAAVIWQETCEGINENKTKIMRRILLQKVQTNNIPFGGFGALEVKDLAQNKSVFTKEFTTKVCSDFKKENQVFPSPPRSPEYNQEGNGLHDEYSVITEDQRTPSQGDAGKQSASHRIKIGIIRPSERDKITFYGKGITFKGSKSKGPSSNKEEEMSVIESTLSKILKTEAEVVGSVEFYWYAFMDAVWNIKEKDILEHIADMQRCDLLFVSNMFDPLPEEIQKAILNLSKTCVVVTYAMNALYNFVPCDEPGHSVIAIGRRYQDAKKYQRKHCQNPEIEGEKLDQNKPLIEGKTNETRKQDDRQEVKCCGDQSCGSTLDFLCGFDFPQEDEEIPKSAAFQAVAVIASILVKAAKLGLAEDIRKRITTTATMHAILRQMSSHPEYHSIDEGWGELQPQRWLDNANTDSLKTLLKYCADQDNKNNYWAGKNV